MEAELKRKLEELVTEWREWREHNPYLSSDFIDGQDRAYNVCADELEAVLKQS